MTAKLNTPTLILISLANMIGGIFLVPAAMAQIGTIALWGWLWTFIGVLGLAYVFGRLSRDYYHPSGILGQSGQAFGPFVEFVMTFSYWFTCLVGNAASIITTTAGIAFFFPIFNQPIYAVSLSLVVLWACVWVVCQGIKVAALFEVFIGLGMVGGILFVTVVGLPHFHWSQIQTHYVVEQGHSLWVLVAAGGALCIWQFMGIETASVMASTVKKPTSVIPRTMLWSVVLAALLCTISCVVVMGSLPYKALLNSDAPYAELVSQVLGCHIGYGFNLIINIVILLSLVGWFLVQAYPPKVAAESGLFPKIFAKENKRGVPAMSLIIGAVLMSVMIILVQSVGSLASQFRQLENFSVLNTILPYFFACISLLMLRGFKKIAVRSKLLEYLAIGVSVLYIAFIAVGLSWIGWLYGVIFCVVAIVLYGLYRVRWS